MQGKPALPSLRQPARYRCGGTIAGRCYQMVRVDDTDRQVLAAVTTVIHAAVSDSPRLRVTLRRAWDRLARPAGHAERAKQVTTLEREIERAKRRLTDAALLLVDGAIDRAGYEGLRDRVQVDLAAAERQLADVRAQVTEPSLPSLDQVLREAGGWAEALARTASAARRDVLSALIEAIVPERVGWGKYEVRITCTPVGETLRRLIQATGAAA